MNPNPSLQQLNDRILQLEEEISHLQGELAILRSQKLVETLLKTDGPLPRENHTVIRTERGLTVKGSRLALYVGAPKCWDSHRVQAAVELPPHRFGALTFVLHHGCHEGERLPEKHPRYL